MGMRRYRLDNQDFHIATEHKYPNGMGNKENHVLEVGLSGLISAICFRIRYSVIFVIKHSIITCHHVTVCSGKIPLATNGRRWA